MIEFTSPPPTHLCANPDCRDREWNLEPLTRALWRLRSHSGVYTMGASQPVCPRCGSSLLLIAAIEPNFEPRPQQPREHRALEAEGNSA